LKIPISRVGYGVQKGELTFQLAFGDLAEFAGMVESPAQMFNVLMGICERKRRVVQPKLVVGGPEQGRRKGAREAIGRFDRTLEGLVQELEIVWAVWHRRERVHNFFGNPPIEGV
jgi:hypothetical protein